MDGKYTFKEFDKNLDDGYQMFFTYVRNRYLLFKTDDIDKRLNIISTDFSHLIL